MAEVEYSTTARLPISAIWDFVEDMDNWATFVTGYESHQKHSEKESVWVLRGDVGALSRRLEFRVRITEWAGPERVCFELEGLNEPMEGAGRFELSRYEEGRETGSEAAEEPASPARGSWPKRLLAAIARFLFRLRHGRVERAATADAGPGEGMARLRFRLRLTPGGPMRPMVDAMIAPMLQPAAEDLANRIMATLEERRGRDGA